MNKPVLDRFFPALETTWPSAARQTVGSWVIRTGHGGGKRVSAATGGKPGDIDVAEKAMAALGQPALFMIRALDQGVDQALAARGYQVVDPVTLYLCRVGVLTKPAAPQLASFAMWPPLEIMREIWVEGGVDAPRQAVMERVIGEKAAILGRAGGRPAGSAFVAIHREIAMIHAIEVTPALRRKGVGINMMRVAAQWAQDNGASEFALAVTDANVAANALYKKLGLTVVGHYHYRIQQK